MGLDAQGQEGIISRSGGSGRGGGLGQTREAQDLKGEEKEDENGEYLEFLQKRHTNLLRIISLGRGRRVCYPCPNQEAVVQDLTWLSIPAAKAPEAFGEKQNENELIIWRGYECYRQERKRT